ncbi:hypothetical protein CMV_012851 [Castanea mollissima]|uniref:Xanthoxin dehydrogenase n=1 Tax=Castanea mollissima TaxID=60419 RepID=A0A8J4R140_9ROSI|nr:hypothetical protein CMV_012851 [Castanea mollissima]
MSTANSGESSLPSQRLLGKLALVTGGATGIGESIVRLFHKHGANVCIVDVQDKLGQHLTSQSINLVHDIMVNNAGLSGSPCSDICNADISEFEKIFDINVKGVFLRMKHAARIMIPLKKGSIISLCSVASVIGGLGPHPYTGSKHAVLGLTKNVAAELGLHGIRVNCVSPYAVATGLALAHMPEEERTEDAMAGFRAFVGKNANLQGVELTVDDVANSVLFLASEEARYVSGANLMIDEPISPNSQETTPEPEPEPASIDLVKLAFEKPKSYMKSLQSKPVSKIEQNPVEVSGGSTVIGNEEGEGEGEGEGVGGGTKEVPVSVKVAMEKAKEYKMNKGLVSGGKSGGEGDSISGIV